MGGCLGGIKYYSNTSNVQSEDGHIRDLGFIKEINSLDEYEQFCHRSPCFIVNCALA